jgi:putative FmdB family regulatory protein
MPLYEYRCAKCGDVFEVIQKFADAPLTVHEGCGGSVERLISTSGFSFKGTGWYVTDYARGSGSKKDSDGDKAKTESKPSSESKSTDSKSQDSKPANSKPSETKTETKTESKPAGGSTKKD